MIWFFLSVAAICASALAGFRMHLSSRPACSLREYDALREEVHKLKGRIDKLSMGKIGA